MLTPGTAPITRAARPRDVLVLVDRSGSMRGCHATVHAAVAAVFRALPAGDAVQLVAFHHDVVALEGDGTRFVANAPELAARARLAFSTGCPPSAAPRSSACWRCRVAFARARDARASSC